MPLLPIGLIAALLAGGAVIVFFLGLARPAQTNVIQSRLETYAVRPKTLEEIELQEPFYQRTIRPVVLQLARLVRQRTPASQLDEIRRKLEIAGIANLDVNQFLGIKVLSAIIFLVILTALAAALKNPPLLGLPIPSILVAPLIGGFLGYYFPNLWLNRKIRARQKEIQLALADALDLMVISVEAGLGFDAAMAKVAEKWDNALSREFARVLIENRLGKSRPDALRDMAARIDLADVTNFVSAIIQADQLGVSIARILTIQAEQMRIKRRQRAEKLAHEAPVKMVIPMVIFMMPTIYLIVLGPIVPRLVRQFGGG
jgi:tight adherence protein C